MLNISKIFKTLFGEKFTYDNFDEKFEYYEDILIENGLCMDVLEKIKKEIRNILKFEKKWISGEEVKRIVKNIIAGNIIVELEEDFIKKLEEIRKKDKLVKILICGFNGSGKTTTVAKLGYLLKKKGYKVLLIAADTFRAASIEQILKWGKEVGIDVFNMGYNIDPAAVAYKGIEYAKENNYDVVIIDTGGRSHMKEDLMRELNKVYRVSNPHFTIFVGDCLSGNDIVEQYDNFAKYLPIDYIIMAKFDLDKKGGSIISILFHSKKPLIYVGVGESKEDLYNMSKEELLKFIFENV